MYSVALCLTQDSLSSNLPAKQTIKTTHCQQWHASIHIFFLSTSCSFCLPSPLSSSVSSAAYFLTCFCLSSPPTVSSVQFKTGALWSEQHNTLSITAPELRFSPTLLLIVLVVNIPPITNILSLFSISFSSLFKSVPC